MYCSVLYIISGYKISDMKMRISAVWRDIPKESVHGVCVPLTVSFFLLFSLSLLNSACPPPPSFCLGHSPSFHLSLANFPFPSLSFTVLSFPFPLCPSLIVSSSFLTSLSYSPLISRWVGPSPRSGDPGYVPDYGEPILPIVSADRSACHKPDG